MTSDIGNLQRFRIHPCIMAFRVKHECRAVRKDTVQRVAGRQLLCIPVTRIPCKSDYPLASVLIRQTPESFLLLHLPNALRTGRHYSGQPPLHYMKVEVMESRHNQLIFKLIYFRMAVCILYNFLFRTNRNYLFPLIAIEADSGWLESPVKFYCPK